MMPTVWYPRTLLHYNRFNGVRKVFDFVVALFLNGKTCVNHLCYGKLIQSNPSKKKKSSR